MDENISNFSAITNADPEVARGFLEMSNNNLEAAVQLFFESPELKQSFGAAGAASAGAASAGAASAGPASAGPASSRQTGTGQQNRPIEIDSDDDDTNMTVYDDDDDDIVPEAQQADAASAAQAARNAQEEEDAAMAKRLQDELYGSGGGGAGGAGAAGGSGLDDVRSPIRATTETLVAPSGFGGGFASNEDEHHTDVLQYARQQMHRRRAALARVGIDHPFGTRSIWDNPDDAAPRRATGGSSNASDERARRLADLFRPPYDLIVDVDWDEARDVGKEEKKWIMVNFQDDSIFQCQMLNRDIWKDEAVRQLVKENFVFLQYTKNSLDAQAFLTFYFANGSHENPDNFPHVSIIDPRTGEQVKVWSGVPFPSAQDFHAQLAEFLDRYSLDSSKKNPVATDPTMRPKAIDVDRMTEEEMLEMAMRNSMATGNSGTPGSQTPSKSNVVDPDALTKAADAVESAQEEAAPPSPFAAIASDKPHTEPENDPATTTRIQFRHPSGRVIRRFALDDSVQRIYEWLKAAPFEGKEGVEFELKQMPQGQDLIQSLETTIRDAGLKQGTVMIEFIED